MRPAPRLLAVLVAASAVPCAAEDAPWGTFSAALTLQSDYVYRGISQNDRQVTPEGSLDWNGPKGFYAGIWLAKIDWTGHDNPSVETDLYAGKHFDLDGTDLNVEAYYYSYPDADFPGSTASYYETIVQLSRSYGPFTLTATGANSPEWGQGAGIAWYGAGTVSYAPTDWLTLSGTLGHQWVQAAPSGYTHWDLGATATWRSWSLDLRYTANDIGTVECEAFWMGTRDACRTTVVATLTYNIENVFE